MVNNDMGDDGMTTETRLAQVESELADVTARLRRLEGETETEYFEPGPSGWTDGTAMWVEAASPPASAHEPESASPDPVGASVFETPAPTAAPSQMPAASRPSTTVPVPQGRSAFDLEEVFGGRVLAWVGGFAIAAGVVLFLFMAMNRGWLDEGTRTIIAAACSLVGLLGGVWLHERRGRTEAARGLVAAAISGLFGTVAAAAQVYSLISPVLGLFFAALVAAAGFAIAVRWRSSLVATLGSLGALAMPLATGVGLSGTGIVFVALALAATVAILVWQRWDWLALGAFLVSAPQLAVWVAITGRDHLVLAVAVLVGFWVLYAVAALGYELRRRVEELPLSSWLLLLGAAVAFVAPGYTALESTGHHAAAVVLLFGFATVQTALGTLALRLRVHRELGSLLIAIGMALLAFALGETFHGPGLVVAWAAAGATLAVLGSRLDASPDPVGSDAARMLSAAGGFLALAILHTLLHEAPPRAIVEGVPDLASAAIALGACVLAALVGGWSAQRISPDGARVAVATGIALAAYGLGDTLHGLALVLAWAGGSVLLAAIGSRLGAGGDRDRMLLGAGAYLALSFGHTLIVEAPPAAIVHGVPDLFVTVAAIVACATSALLGARLVRDADRGVARAAAFVGASILVYLASVLIVDTIGVTATGDVRQAGQTWLSVFWTSTGLGAVLVGLLRRKADVRLAGLALLGVAIAKVWTFDLAELDQLSRVLSFVGLGFLLLVGAFAYGRIKPEAGQNEEVTR